MHSLDAWISTETDFSATPSTRERKISVESLLGPKEEFASGPESLQNVERQDDYSKDLSAGSGDTGRKQN